MLEIITEHYEEFWDTVDKMSQDQYHTFLSKHDALDEDFSSNFIDKDSRDSDSM